MISNLVKNGIVVATVILLASCTQKFSDVNATAKEALFGGSDVVLSAERIKSIPYASMYVKVNDGGKAFMVLALVEKNKITGKPMLKWMSADKGVIVTEEGRIVKTIALHGTNLNALTSRSAPKFQFNGSHTEQWLSTYDWQPGYRFGYEAVNTRRYLEKEVLESSLWSKKTQKQEETTQINALGSKLTNTFWVDEQNNVVKSVQYIGPDMTRIETQILKSYAD